MNTTRRLHCLKKIGELPSEVKNPNLGIKEYTLQSVLGGNWSVSFLGIVQ